MNPLAPWTTFWELLHQNNFTFWDSLTVNYWKVCALGHEVNRGKQRCGYVTTDTIPTMENIHSSTFQCLFPGVGILEVYLVKIQKRRKLPWIWCNVSWWKWRGTQKPLDESESGEWKSWLKAQHSENEDHGIPPLHGKQMGKQWKQCQTLFFWAPKSLQMVTAAMKLKDAYSLEGKLWPT